MTQQKAQSANFGPMWPEVTGFWAGSNKRFFALENAKNLQSWPRLPCLPFSGRAFSLAFDTLN